MGQTAVEQAVSVIDYAIGENVDVLRKRAGLTKAELGARFGVGGPAMSLKISGKRSWSAADVKFASQLFIVRVAQIYGDEPLPDPSAPATVTDISEMAGRRRSVGRTGLEPVTDGLWVAPVTPIRALRDQRHAS